MKKQEARSNTVFPVFGNHEMDWTFKRTLEQMSEKGAESGECLWAAAQIDKNNIDSWIDAWSVLAERVEKLGDVSMKGGHLISARDCYLRASNYYRTAEYGCSPSKAVWNPLWQKSVDTFQKAAALFDPPVEYIEIPFEGFKLPGYFMRPAKDDVKRPTLLIVGGNDSSGEEMVFDCGFAAIRRGYNFLTVEYPGHRGAVHLDPNCVKRQDYEKPFAKIIDHLLSLPGVDERIALAGFSFGGYVVNRVACFEPRIKALIPDSPVIDMEKLSTRFFDRFPAWMPVWLRRNLFSLNMKRNPMMKALLDYSLHTWGCKGDLFEFIEKGYSSGMILDTELANITCPVLGLVSDAEGPMLLSQAKEFITKIGSKDKTLKILSLDVDGTDDHCQLDNISRAAQIIFDWLDEHLK
jgi:pimeloyl-ACP methyl ester carboxylesterase